MRNTNNCFEKKYLISLVGPTAVGKTSMAIELANAFNSEIISADSRQFYRELSIGTAKPTAIELASAKHHFINHLSISENYNASDFEKEAIDLISQLHQKLKVLILCGGSGMYINAVLNGFDQGVPTADEEIRKELNSKLQTSGITVLQNQLKKLDPEFYEQVDKQNSKRLMRAIEVCLISGKKYSDIRKGTVKKRDFEIIKIGLDEERSSLYERINKRVDGMMSNGLLKEAKSVINFREKNALKTVGYKELFEFRDGTMSLAEAVEKIKVNSRRYAKRQLTWFKQEQEIEWFETKQKVEIIKYIRKRIANHEQSQ